MKPFAIYGTVPRGSKTSTKEVIMGLPLFFHCSKSETSGNIVVYYNKKPFPRLFVAAGMTYWKARDKAEAYVKKHYLDLVKVLQSYDPNLGLPRAVMDTLGNGSQYDYEIVTSENKKDFMRLYVARDKQTEEFVYLYAYPENRHTSESLYEEYKRRLNDKK